MKYLGSDEQKMCSKITVCLTYIPHHASKCQTGHFRGDAENERQKDICPAEMSRERQCSRGNVHYKLNFNVCRKISFYFPALYRLQIEMENPF